MRKPIRYTPEIHSFLNAITTHHDNRDNIILLLQTNFLNASGLPLDKEVAELYFKYYTTINRYREKPVKYDIAVSDHIEAIG